MASNFNFWMGFVMGGALAAMIVRIRETLVRRRACPHFFCTECAKAELGLDGEHGE